VPLVPTLVRGEREQVSVQLLLGDCRNSLPSIPSNSVDSCVTDPPYELGFDGGKGWDSTGVAYDIRVWSQVLRILKPGAHLLAFSGSRTYHRMACAIEDAGFEVRDQMMWIYGSGFPHGQNLKPAHEPICVARKPGRGFLQIEASRVGVGEYNRPAQLIEASPHAEGQMSFKANRTYVSKAVDGRWPSNIIADEEAIVEFPEQARKFYYCPKASKRDREEGLNLPPQTPTQGPTPAEIQGTRMNVHPTVKPNELMRYLVKLATPAGGKVLDPFMGSGSTGKAAVGEGFSFIGCERERQYMQICQQRIEAAMNARAA